MTLNGLTAAAADERLGRFGQIRNDCQGRSRLSGMALVTLNAVVLTRPGNTIRRRSQTFASWNQIAGWLRRLEGLRTRPEPRDSRTGIP